MISKEKIQLVIDLLYFDSQKSQQDQRPLTKLAEESKVSSSTVVKVRNILKDMGILSITGFTTKYQIFWNPEYTKPNDKLTESVYQKYANIKSKTTVAHVFSIERVVKFLMKEGYEGTIYKKTKKKINGIEITNTEEYNL